MTFSAGQVPATGSFQGFQRGFQMKQPVQAKARLIVLIVTGHLYRMLVGLFAGCN